MSKREMEAVLEKTLEERGVSLACLSRIREDLVDKECIVARANSGLAIARVQVERRFIGALERTLEVGLAMG